MAVQLAPLNARYQRAVAAALRLRGRYEEAERHCRAALHLRPDDAEAHFEMMKILRDRSGTGVEVAEEIRAAVALEPANPQFRYYLGTILEEQGKVAVAIAEYEAALRLFPQQRPRETASAWAHLSLWLSYMEGAHFSLVRANQRAGRRRQARVHQTEFQRISEYHIRANQLMGRIGNRPADAALRFGLAGLHARAGFLELAREQYRAGLQLAPQRAPRRPRSK